MCGIYGMVGAGAETVLPRMSAALVHRGPDGDGWAVRGAGGVGCRRLAIIDVAGGAQPLANETGDVIVVCNGEIYNHAALRAALESRGHRFRTHSDAEVLPHLYEERGIDFVHALDGMFGLALWDARRGRLVLARDRMGEKPLYHATTAAGFLFASEPKALLASGHVGREPDWAALAAYLRTGYVPNPASAFAAIQKLPPGGRFVLEGEAARAPRARGARRAGERRAARRLPLGRARLDRHHGRHPLRRRRAEHLRPRLRAARLRRARPRGPRRARARHAPSHAHHHPVALPGGGAGSRPAHRRAARRPGVGADLSPLPLRALAREDGAGRRGGGRALRRPPDLSGRGARGPLRAPPRRRAAGRRGRRARAGRAAGQHHRALPPPSLPRGGRSAGGGAPPGVDRVRGRCAPGG